MTNRRGPESHRADLVSKALRVAGYAVAFTFAGCSTLEVTDRHVVKGTDSELMSFGGDGINVTARMNPDGRFGSIGVLGAPAIPVYANAKPERTLILDIVLTLRVNHAFSFAPMPCLTSTDAPPICPSNVTIEAKAMSVDSGEKAPNGARRYGHIAQFYERPYTAPIEVSLPRSPMDARITSDEIYAHYRYQQDPPWVFLEARLTYRYDCVAECPSEFSIDMKDVAVVEKALSTDGVFAFRKQRSTDYQATRVLQ